MKSIHRNMFFRSLLPTLRSFSRSILFLTLLWTLCSLASGEDDLGEVCFDNLGCFSVRDCPITGKWLNSLPDKPENINTTFTLHTGNSSTLISYEDIASLSVVQSGKLAVIIHGFGAIGEHLPAMRDELVKVHPQVIMVDWQRASRLPYFNYAVVNTQLVGHQIAYLLSLLNEHRGVEYKDVHLIGFSLGAHVAAFGSRWLKKTYGGKIGRITALDAASPFFESTCFHLNTSDADYVDAIHTNGVDRLPKIKTRVGSRAPYAHVDFYPNGGEYQPQCAGRWWDVICNHYASIEYFRATIQFRHFCSFSANKCANGLETLNVDNGAQCTEGPNSAMGYFSNRYEGRGVYTLKTMGIQPFCLS